MKKFISLCVLILFANIGLFSQERIVISNLQKPHQITVDRNDLYIFDETDYSLHVYSISPFGLKLKVGHKGDGPYDFKYLPFVYVQAEALVCTDFTKTIWFSKDGKILRIKNYVDFENFDLSAEMLLYPVKEKFLQITADHDLNRRNVYLLDSEFRQIKDLYTGSFVWRTDSPILYRTDTVAYNDLIFISDTLKGFYMKVFDLEGNLLYTIDKSQGMEQVTDRPLMHQFNISDEKIYATTYKKIENNTEMIILDLKGHILERLYLPLPSIQPKRGVLRFDLFFVNQEKLYELIKNPSSEKWELLITNLELLPMI